jgi:ABC-type transport system involved in multi-copper enzyme maturation permease subunit
VEEILRNGVALKELRTTMRTRRSGAVITCYLGALGLAAATYLLAHLGPGSYGAQQVVQLFQVLAIVQLSLLLVVVPLLCAGSVNLEYRSRTWDLLLLTRFSSFSILWGKLVAGTAFNLLLLAASFPVFGLGVLFRAIGPGDVLRTFAVCAATVFLLEAISLVASTQLRSWSGALSVTICMSVLLSFGLSAAIQLLGNSAAMAIGPYTVTPQLARLAPLDPFAGLVSALPDGGSAPIFGPLGGMLPAGPPTWLLYIAVALALSCGLFAAATVRLQRLRAPAAEPTV